MLERNEMVATPVLWRLEMSNARRIAWLSGSKSCGAAQRAGVNSERM